MVPMSDGGDASPYDVIIVGGRPAGASLAARLGAAGLRVLILDRATFPSLPAVSAWSRASSATRGSAGRRRRAATAKATSRTASVTPDRVIQRDMAPGC